MISKIVNFSVMFLGLLLKITSTIPYAKFCASEKKTVRDLCLPKLGVSMIVVHRN
jgi:hypothetical protein